VAVDTSLSGSINRRIKMSAQWQDVAKLIDDYGDDLTPTNAAYAFYRIGCIFCFLSEQRKTGLPAQARIADSCRRPPPPSAGGANTEAWSRECSHLFKCERGWAGHV
jgi:hypothetical protein